MSRLRSGLSGTGYAASVLSILGVLSFTLVAAESFLPGASAEAQQRRNARAAQRPPAPVAAAPGLIEIEPRSWLDPGPAPVEVRRPTYTGDTFTSGDVRRFGSRGNDFDVPADRFNGPRLGLEALLQQPRGLK
jgi:hypothetical protein